MESIVYNELVNRGYNVDIGLVDSYSRDENGKKVVKRLEVDFVCNQGRKRYYIQSASGIPSLEKLHQETASFDSIRDSFKKIILSERIAKVSNAEKGYTTINVIDFPLDPNSLDF